MVRIKSFWIAPVSDNFFIDFFNEYFGDTNLLKPILLILLLVYTLHVLLKSKDPETGKIKDKPLQFSFLALSIWIFVTFLIPYLRSLLSVPMLFPRYTIVILPAFLMILAYGIELINNKLVKYLILSFFITLSVVDIVYVKNITQL